MKEFSEYDPTPIFNIIIERKRIINEGATEEVVNLARELDIFQISHSKMFDELVNNIKERLTKDSYDIESLRT